MVEAIGTCYEDAWRFLIKEEEGELVHGTVESLGRRIGHAWVELPTGFIWEPETRQFLKKADFEAIAKPLEEARYSATEAAIMLARVGKHGPWTEQERQMLKRGNPEGGEEIAKELNLRYDGIQEEVGMQFTDIHGTGTTFYATSMEDARKRLSEKRGLFGMAKGGTPVEVTPEVRPAVPEVGVQPLTDEAIIQRGKDLAPLLAERNKAGRAIELVREQLDSLKKRLGLKDVSPALANQLRRDIENLTDDFNKAIKIESAANVRYQEAVMEWGRKWQVAKPPAEGGNPVRTEAERKSFHERIFGKGSSPPLERLGKGQIINDLTPMSPEQGPPLPRSLGIRWPWRN